MGRQISRPPRPEWATPDIDTANSISRFKHIISGLALRRVHHPAEMFEHLGILYMGYNSMDEPAATWFDSLSE